MAKKSLSVTLYMSEIIYDVQNKTYLTGRSRQNGQNHEEVANMMNNDDDENLNQVLRSIGNAFASLKTRLSEYLTDTGTTSNNILIDGATDLTISLLMPSNFNQATKDSISGNAHQFIVNTAIAEWFTITDKNDAQDYVNMAAGNIAQIREAINKRVQPTRTAVTP